MTKSSGSTRIPANTEHTGLLLFQKVGIFVDAENIEMSGLKHHEGRTDYKRILDNIGDREIIRILYYKPEFKEISQTFSSFWTSLGGEFRRPQKNADSFLIVDAITMADRLDVVILLGGDKDYLPLIWYLRSRGCRVEIWSWPETTSEEVQEAADIYIPLTKDYIILESQNKSSANKRRKSSKKRAPQKKSDEQD
ncbi:MAG: NYN domain-containing protein [Bdellovibrionales bacterium]|nr:NYN domain-containing protein [Bdellovibrionales bacterium]